MERLSPVTAIRRSWELTSGSAGRALVTLAVQELIASIGLGILIQLISSRGGGSSRRLGSVLAGLAASSARFCPGLDHDRAGSLYVDLRVRNEDFDGSQLAGPPSGPRRGSPAAGERVNGQPGVATGATWGASISSRAAITSLVSTVGVDAPAVTPTRLQPANHSGFRSATVSTRWAGR